MPTHVITLELDADSFSWLNGLRIAHFPPALNYLDAHVTLLHQADAEGVKAIEQVILAHRTAVPLAFVGLRSLGRGVAVVIQSPALTALRRDLAVALTDRLTRQDEQTFRPHVTIQNKVEPAKARALLNELTAAFSPRTGVGTAVLIWDYLGGPWRLRARISLPDGTTGKAGD